MQTIQTEFGPMRAGTVLESFKEILDKLPEGQVILHQGKEWTWDGGAIAEVGKPDSKIVPGDFLLSDIAIDGKTVTEYFKG